jgi:hypothetical protein
MGNCGAWSAPEGDSSQFGGDGQQLWARYGSFTIYYLEMEDHARDSYMADMHDYCLIIIFSLL